MLIWHILRLLSHEQSPTPIKTDKLTINDFEHNNAHQKKSNPRMQDIIDFVIERRIIKLKHIRTKAQTMFLTIMQSIIIKNHK